MLKTLLVHISSERSSKPAIDCAVSLAASLGAHLDAVAIGYESVGSVGLVADSGASLALMEMEYGLAQERADAAVAEFEAAAVRATIAHASRTFSAGPAEAARTMGVVARLYDLTIVLQPEYSRRGYDDYVPEEVLFNSGGPMLMVPYIHQGPLDARNIGITWDGSRVAARALRDAMPFLTAATTVIVIAVNEDRDVASDAGLAELAVQLERRGIPIRIERLQSDKSDIHNAILSAAADYDIGLLVMGGYGHSHLKERILGGVTKGIFESMTVPTLMSH
jgi:nucleotide-binding universal stress UspA family protein